MPKKSDDVKLLAIANNVVTAFSADNGECTTCFALMDTKIDELWRKAFEKCPTLFCAWVEGFAGDGYYEQFQNSKLEAKETLTSRHYQTDPRKNFLSRLLRNEPWSYDHRNRTGEYHRGHDLAMFFFN